MLAEPVKPSEVPDNVSDVTVVTTADGVSAELVTLTNSLRGDLNAALEQYNSRVLRLLSRCSTEVSEAKEEGLRPESSEEGPGKGEEEKLEAKQPDAKAKVESPHNCEEMGKERAKAGEEEEEEEEVERGISSVRFSAAVDEMDQRTSLERMTTESVNNSFLDKTFEMEEAEREKMSRNRTCQKQQKIALRQATGLLDADPGRVPLWTRFRSAVQEIVESRRFEIFFCLLIMSNTLFFGIEAEYNANVYDSEALLVFSAISRTYTLLFFIELVMRILAQGLSFFCASDYGWNCFDTCIVAVSLLEVIIITASGEFDDLELESTSNLMYMRVLRIARSFRIFRIIRIVSFFRPLRLLLLSVFSTLRSLFWTVLLMLLMMYMFGVLFTQAVTGYRYELAKANDGAASGAAPEYDDDDNHLELLNMYFGSVSKCVYTLFKSITGGVDWQVVVDPLTYVHAVWVGLFVLYIAFSFFAVLNVVTGVFCQTAIESAMRDQEEVMNDQKHATQAYIDQLTGLFRDVDHDKSGELTIDEFEDLLKDERLQRYCASLDIKIDDAWALFKLLDTDASGAIGVEEFVTGCLRLRGGARSVDLALSMYQQQWFMTQVWKFMCYVDVRFEGLAEQQEQTLGKVIHRGESGRFSISKTEGGKSMVSPGSFNKLGLSTWDPLDWKG